MRLLDFIRDNPGERLQSLVDWETYYSSKLGISVKQQGNKVYAKNADGYILCFVPFHKASKQLFLEDAFVGTKEEFVAWAAEQSYDFDIIDPWAANSNFDETFTDKHFGSIFSAPWQCVLDLGKHHQLPADLERLSHAVLGERLIDKTLRGEMDGVHWEQLSPEKQTAMKEYCLKDGVVAAKVVIALPSMTTIEKAVAEHTRRISKRGIQIDVERLDQDIATLHQVVHKALHMIPWATLIDPKTKEPAAPLSMPFLRRWCKLKNIPAPKSRKKDSEELEDLMTEHPLLAEIIGHMRKWSKANTLLKKCLTFRSRVDEDGIMPPELLYCGAPHTRRWAAKGIQIHNLDGEPICFTEEDEAEMARMKKEHPEDWKILFKGGIWTRRYLIPRPGKKLYIADFSQIEPRCLHLLVGDTPLLDKIRAGFGLYEAASIARGRWSPEKGKLKKEDPRLYKYEKAGELGLGYGCGKVKYVVVAKSMADLDLTAEEAEKAVDEWRRSNPKVTGLWKTLDEALVSAVREKGEHHLDITMPTGENLRHWYIRARFETDPITKEKKNTGWQSLTVRNDPSSVSVRLWGGKLTENVIQRMARDVMAWAILALEAAGHVVLFHVHDEIIFEVDEENPEAEVASIDRIMRTPPPWALDLPLDTEGGLFPHYVKT